MGELHIMMHLFALLSLLLCGVCYTGFRSDAGISKRKGVLSPAVMLFGVALLLRLLLAYTTHGFSNDIACFAGWADRIFTVGPGQFYSSETFTDYPPGFMYVLYVIGALRNLLKISYYSDLHILLLKLPAILCDIACGYLLYREAAKRLHLSELQSLCIAAVYLFQPVIILNSSCWGQVDSVHTLIVILMCLFLMDGKMLPAYAVYGVGVLLKPQTLIFTPVLLVGILDHVLLKDFSWRKLFYNLCGGLAVICGMLLLCTPFGLHAAISQYTSTLGSYEYAAVNAYNFWGLLGMNWVDQNTTFLFLPCKTWGTIVILLIVLFTFLIAMRCRREPSRYFCLGAFIILTMFVFSVRMHERYMYPGLALLLFCCLYKSADALWKCYAGFCVLHFYNTADVLYHYDPQNYDRKAPIILLVSAGMLCCLYYFYKIIWRLYVCDKASSVTNASGTSKSASGQRFDTKASSSDRKSSGCSSFGKNNSPVNLGQLLKEHLMSPLEPVPSEPRVVFTKVDLGLLLLICALYSFFALYDLGDSKAPVTTYNMVQNQTIELEFSEKALPAKMASYIAPWHQRHFTVEVGSNTEDSWTYLGEMILDNVFTWQDVSLQDMISQYTQTGTSSGGISPRYVRLTLTDTDASLIELVFTDTDGNITRPVNADTYETLFDEADLYPERYSFRNSMYFDEIYHARTAYEFLHGLTTYENTHPPLGKIFISLGVAIFGMNPFGWRITGTLFGIAMLPFLYLFGKKMTRNTPAAALACFLFAFDFMHFTQTRIATIDVYITFFVIAMYYFMYSYCTMSFYDTPLYKTFVPLGLCGICMGFGIACKWTGVYAGCGLALLFFAHLFRRYREYLYAKAHPGKSSNGIDHREIVKNFSHHTIKTIDFCLTFFVLIPAVIYLLSYLPFVDNTHTGLFDRMLANQTSMFNYHSGLESTHPYASSWYQWPTMERPIWYYSGYLSDVLKEGISAFGNPLVWWMGIPAFLYVVYLLISRNSLLRSLAGNSSATTVAASKSGTRSVQHGTPHTADSASEFAPNILSRAEYSTAVFLTVGYLAQYLPWFFVTRITFIYHYFPSVPFVVLMIVYSLMQLKKRVSDRTFIIICCIYAILVFALFLLFYPVLSGQPVAVDFVIKYLRWQDTWVLISG